MVSLNKSDRKATVASPHTALLHEGAIGNTSVDELDRRNAMGSTRPLVEPTSKPTFHWHRSRTREIAAQTIGCLQHTQCTHKD